MTKVERKREEVLKEKLFCLSREIPSKLVFNLYETLNHRTVSGAKNGVPASFLEDASATPKFSHWKESVKKDIVCIKGPNFPLGNHQ